MKIKHDRRGCLATSLSATILNGVERGWKSIVVEARREEVAEVNPVRSRKRKRRRRRRNVMPDIVIHDSVACSVAGESAWKNLWGSAIAKDWFVRTPLGSVDLPPPLHENCMERRERRWKIYLVSGIRAKKKVLLPGSKIVGTPPRDLVNRWGPRNPSNPWRPGGCLRFGERGDIERRPAMKNFYRWGTQRLIHK